MQTPSSRRDLTAIDPDPPGGVESEQLARLQALLATVADSNEFQRQRLEGARVDSMADLARLPQTTKLDLVEDQRAHPPFGSNLTYPLDRYTQLHQTTGTTGAPLSVLCTAEDWGWWRSCFGVVLAAAGIDAPDRAALAFSFGPYVHFWAAYEGVQELGAMVLALGGMGSVQRLETMRDYEATALLCTPSYAIHLGEVAHQRGLEGALEPVERVVCTGEPGASLEPTRARIEELWGARCHDHAGLTEVGSIAYPCAEHGGLHVNEREILCEILRDDGTPVADGEHGELVLTALGRTGFPAIRYRTGDVVVRSPDPCPAGHSHRWLPGGIVGRTDDMVVIRGMNVFPSGIEQTLREIDPEVGEFRITFYTEPGAMDEVRLEVELSASASARAIQERMMRRLGLRVRVVPVRRGVLPEARDKARRVVDTRTLEGPRIGQPRR